MKKNLFIIVFMLALLYAAFSCSYLPTEENLGDTIAYTETPNYIFLDPGNGSNTCFMFMPGGLVDPHAYLTLMERIAEDSICVLIPKFTSNLAITGLSKYKHLIEQFPEIDNWYVGGHSLGGIAALSAVNNDPDMFRGLILLGTYPSESFANPDWSGQVLSIYAENDLLSTSDEIESAQMYLPTARFMTNIDHIDTLNTHTPSTIYYLISGGNHAQFGDYGTQDGDGMPEITLLQQHEQTHHAIMAFIRWVENE